MVTKMPQAISHMKYSSGVERHRQLHQGAEKLLLWAGAAKHPGVDRGGGGGDLPHEVQLRRGRPVHGFLDNAQSEQEGVQAAAVSVIGFMILLVCASVYMVYTLRKGDD